MKWKMSDQFFLAGFVISLITFAYCLVGMEAQTGAKISNCDAAKLFNTAHEKAVARYGK